MTAVLKSLMVEIIVPYMNAHTIHGGYLEHNPASRRVFEKCGYSFVGLTPNAFTINPSKLDGLEDKKVGLGLLSWVRRSSN
jgi:RimJ/RimL family protein N-acetyltransferase